MYSLSCHALLTCDNGLSVTRAPGLWLQVGVQWYEMQTRPPPEAHSARSGARGGGGAPTDTCVLRTYTHRSLRANGHTESAGSCLWLGLQPPAVSGGPVGTCLTHRVPLSFQAWKAHLMGAAGCTMNLRRTHVLHKPAAPPPGELGPSGRGVPVPPLAARAAPAVLSWLCFRDEGAGQSLSRVPLAATSGGSSCRRPRGGFP